MTDDADQWFVRPQQRHGDTRLHHPAADADPHDPVVEPLCDRSEQTEQPFIPAKPGDTDRMELCAMCRAIAQGEADPRGDHGGAGREPEDVLADAGFDPEEVGL